VLTALERAEALKRRKEIYEAKYPEARRPQGGRRPKNSDIVSPFTENTAQKIGLSQRTIQREVQIAEKIDKEVKEKIRNTELANNKNFYENL